MFVKLRGDPSGIERLGLSLGTIAGEVATATVELRDVPAVAGSDDVVFMELSRPLGPDLERGNRNLG